MLDGSGGLVGEGWEKEAHFIAPTMPDDTWQPDTIAKIAQLYGDLGIGLDRWKLPFRKFY